MNKYVEELDFELLGQKLKFYDDDLNTCSKDKVEAEKLIEYVVNEVEKIQKRYPQVNDDKKMAVICAVELAKDKMLNDLESQKNISKFSTLAIEVMHHIEEANLS